MYFIDTVIPKQANNDFRGGKIPLYGFCLLLLPVVFRTFVHFLKDDSGVNSIASIHLFPGDPDPNNVIYMYSSLWGGQQAITLIIYLVVLFRYRNLIPLMFLLMLLMRLLRLLSLLVLLILLRFLRLLSLLILLILLRLLWLL